MTTRELKKVEWLGSWDATKRHAHDDMADNSFEAACLMEALGKGSKRLIHAAMEESGLSSDYFRYVAGVAADRWNADSMHDTCSAALLDLGYSEEMS